MTAKKDVRFVAKALGKTCAARWEGIGIAVMVEGLNDIKPMFGRSKS